MSADDKARERASDNDKAELVLPQPVMSAAESSGTPQSRASNFFGPNVILRPILLLFTIFVCLHFSEYTGYALPWFGSLQTVDLTIGTCPQAPVPPHDSATEVYNTDIFRRVALERLQGAVRIQTQVYDDMGNPQDESQDERWLPFLDFHQYLNDTFPLVHARFELTKINNYALVYILPGSDPSLKPTMLTAHMDVVPVPEGSWEEWTHIPFDAHFDGTWVWGRGASDCKNNLIGLLTTFEHLLDPSNPEVFTPRRTIVLAFGSDEESNGSYGAGQINKFLLGRYGKDGIAAILDEGGSGLQELYGRAFALPAVAEKGAADVEIEIRSPGGHSSVPPEHTSIGYMAKFITALEDPESKIYQPVLTLEHPIYEYLECLTTHGLSDRVPKLLKRLLRLGRVDLLAQWFAAQGPAERFLLETSVAGTIVQGGVKTNALPERATLNINSRVEITQSISEHETALTNFFIPLASSLDLSLDAFGTQVITAPDDAAKGNITIRMFSNPSDASPITATKAMSGGLDKVWEAFGSAVKGAFGADVIAAPSLMTGNTDTRNYLELSGSILRWSPAKLGTRLNAHTRDERVMLDTHIEGIRFYTYFVKSLDQMEDE